MSQPKTVRFDALVKASGQPEQVTLWTRPEADTDFMKAVRDHRVATVIQQNVGTKKDFGFVGFDARKNAAYLIFPRRLAPPEKAKIIGIKYDRIATPSPKGPVFKPKSKTSPGIPLREKPSYRLEDTLEAPAQKKPSRPAKTPPPKTPPPKKTGPKLYTFTASVILTAVEKTSLTVEAPTPSAAAKLIRSQSADLTLNLANAKITRRILKPTRKKY